MSRTSRWLVALSLCSAGCFFSFQNPVSSQSAGTVTGGLKLGEAVTGQSIVGAQVDLLWSNLSVTVGSSGHFDFLSLPDGTYTLRYTVPGPTPSIAPAIGERQDVYLPTTPGGTPDTMAIGTITINTAGTVEGTVVGQQANVPVAAFTQPTDGGFPSAYEGYSTLTDETGHYVLVLPAGPHTLWASTATQSASLLVTAETGTTLTGQDLTLATPAGDTGAALVGYAVIGDLGADAPLSQVQAIVGSADGGLGITLNPPCTTVTCPLSFAFQDPVPSLGVTALQVEQNLQPGQLYQIEVAVPGQSQIPPLVISGIPAIAGVSTFLNQIFLLSQKTIDANAADAVVDGGTSSGTGGNATNGGSGSTTGGSGGSGNGGGSSTGSGAAVVAVLTPFLPGGIVDTAIPLPTPGGQTQLLFSAVSDGGEQIQASNESGQTFLAPQVLWNGSLGAIQPGSLVAASYNEGQSCAAAWLYSGDGNTVAAGLQSPDGGWTSTVLPPVILQTPTSAGSALHQQLALAYDQSSGTPWLIEVSSAGTIVAAPLSGQAAAQTFSAGTNQIQHVAAASCSPADLDGGTGICLAFTDNGLPQGFWTAIVVPSGKSLAAVQVTTGNPGDTLAGPAVCALDGGVVAVAFAEIPAGESAYQYSWTEYSHLAQILPVTTIAAQGNGLPSLFDLGTGVLVFNATDNLTTIGSALGSSGSFSASVGQASPPFGYIDSSGRLQAAELSGAGISIDVFSASLSP